MWVLSSAATESGLNTKVRSVCLWVIFLKLTASECPATGETKWVDTTVVHTAAESYREREFKSVMARNVSTSTAAALASTDVLKFQASPIVLERAGAKNDKYSRSIWIAKKQTQQKKRRQAPQFSAFCCSDFGELSPSAFNMLD